LDHCPTLWDDTKVLAGSIGEHAVIARRSGENWFIGAMNSDETRAFATPLSFLRAGQRYVAHVYSDDPSVPTRTHVRIDRFCVRRETVFRVSMGARGGQTLRVVPATAQDQYPPCVP
jgi:alpha-glucosidase